MTKVTEPQFIESTAGQVAAELARRGIAPDQHVTVTIEPNNWLTEVRKFSPSCSNSHHEGIAVAVAAVYYLLLTKENKG